MDEFEHDMEPGVQLEDYDQRTNNNVPDEDPDGPWTMMQHRFTQLSTNAAYLQGLFHIDHKI